MGVRGWEGRSRGRLAAECWVQDQTKMVAEQVTWGKAGGVCVLVLVGLGLALEVWRGRWGVWHSVVRQGMALMVFWALRCRRRDKNRWKRVSLNVKRTAFCEHEGNQRRQVMEDWPKTRQTESALTQNRTSQPHFGYQKKEKKNQIKYNPIAHSTRDKLLSQSLQQEPKTGLSENHSKQQPDPFTPSINFSLATLVECAFVQGGKQTRTGTACTHNVPFHFRPTCQGNYRRWLGVVKSHLRKRKEVKCAFGYKPNRQSTALNFNLRNVLPMKASTAEHNSATSHIPEFLLLYSIPCTACIQPIVGRIKYAVHDSPLIYACCSRLT